ncbi:MAG: UDP-N-acetylmuramoyl-L-alanine--D-glutamate ligase [Verrucomicrobia bacterium]|nr:MAG: UDP-N-acetylmuramoyl-L-alanine--D-glutamate ligase [Verrucomicrobiota bacterium]
MMNGMSEFLKKHFEKEVAIFGNGVSGKAVAHFLNFLGVAYVIYDQKDGKEGEEINKAFSEESCLRHSLVIFSPGFSLEHDWLKLAKEKGCCCLGELDFGGLFWKGKIIAITGTNGKSTLTKFLAEAFHKIGMQAIACGNIGDPLCAQYRYFKDEDRIAVCEVSSFQAEGLCYFSPDVVLWTNFDEDHLDRYQKLEDYFEAKWNLVKQLKSDHLFVTKSVKEFGERQGYCFPKETVFIDVNSFEKTGLNVGIFSNMPQLENYLLALSYWNRAGYDGEVLKETALSFTSLRYRLERVACIKGKVFWNDGKGTNFLATQEALKRFGHKVFWIGGGKSKGGNLEGFVEKINPYIKKAFLMGQTAPELARICEGYGIRAGVYHSLEDAVEAAFNDELVDEIKDIVFSPGFASFDMYANAEERGFFFEKKVLELKRDQNNLEMALAY